MSDNKDWIEKMLRLCEEAEKQLNDYHARLKKDMEEYLRLTDEVRKKRGKK